MEKNKIDYIHNGYRYKIDVDTVQELKPYYQLDAELKETNQAFLKLNELMTKNMQWQVKEFNKYFDVINNQKKTITMLYLLSSILFVLLLIK